MSFIDIKELNLLKYADKLIDNIKDKGLIEMIMNKQFTFLILQDGTFKYYKADGTHGTFDEIGEGRTFAIFNEKTNIIIRGDCSGKIFFDMYKQEQNKWITAVDTFFVENNNKLSFHDPEKSKMYFFVGEEILQVYSYAFVLLNDKGEKVKSVEQAVRFAVLVQNIEEVTLKNIPLNVQMSKYGLFIIMRQNIQFYKFETNELIDIQLPKQLNELRNFTTYIHSQTSDLLLINEIGEIYLIDPRASVLVPIRIGQIRLPNENYQIYFYYRYLLILTNTRIYVYNIRIIKNPFVIELNKNFDVSSTVPFSNPDVSIGFYSNSLKTFNEFLFNEKMTYHKDMSDGMLYLLLNDFKNTLIGVQHLNEQLVTRFLDRLGNDLPLIIFLSTKPEYREYAIQRFKQKYTHEYLLSMANEWDPNDVESYFEELQTLMKPQPVALKMCTKKEWKPTKFNMADVTVQLSNNPTEEKIDKVYSLLGITNINQVIDIPEDLIASIVNHETNWLRPLIIPLLILRPYELLQHMIIITYDLSKLDIIMIFQQVFSLIDLYKQNNTLNKDQMIVYALFLTVISSFNKSLQILEEELLPIFMERLLALPLDKLQINYKTLCIQSLKKVLKNNNFEMANVIYGIILRRYTPSAIETLLQNILQAELQLKSGNVEVKNWLIQKIASC